MPSYANPFARPPRTGGGAGPVAPRPPDPVPNVPQDSGVAEPAEQEPLQRATGPGPAQAGDAETGGGDAGEGAIRTVDLFDLARYVANHVTDYYAVETPDKSWVIVRKPLKDSTLYDHLSGREAVGVYTTRQADSTCRFVCWDLDTLAASYVYSLVSTLPLPYIVERTGGNGRHVWQFFAEPQPAGAVRAYALRVAKAAGLPDTVECFPKQDPRAPGQVGNLVRLPFGQSRKTGGWSTVELGEWGWTPASVLQPPARGSRAAQVESPERADTSGSEPRQGWLAKLWAGEDVAGGRNNSLWKLAVWLRARDFPPAAVDSVVTLCNTVQVPPLDAEELAKLLRR